MLKRHADNDQILSYIRQNLSIVSSGCCAKGKLQLELCSEAHPDDPEYNNDHLGYLYAEQGKKPR